MHILIFLLEILFFALIAAALLRVWMNRMRLPMSHQPGRFAVAITDWLVLPVRRVLPAALARSRVDWGSLVAAALLAQAYAGLSLLLHSMVGAMPAHVWPVLLLLAIRMVLRVLLQGLMFLLLAYAVLSWVQPHASARDTLERLCSPLLGPLRRRLPVIGGVDLSVLVLLILLQVGLLMLG
ncbi:MAG: YggT family protein [Hydrogenophaga sp.]